MIEIIMETINGVNSSSYQFNARTVFTLEQLKIIPIIKNCFPFKLAERGLICVRVAIWKQGWQVD